MHLPVSLFRNSFNGPEEKLFHSFPSPPSFGTSLKYFARQVNNNSSSSSTSPATRPGAPPSSFAFSGSSLSTGAGAGAGGTAAALFPKLNPVNFAAGAGAADPPNENFGVDDSSAGAGAGADPPNENFGVDDAAGAGGRRDPPQGAARCAVRG